MQTYYLNDFKAKIPRCEIPEKMQFIDPETVDFEVKLFVPPSGMTYTATHKGVNYKNCDVVDGQIRIIADGHQLSPGEVWYEATYYLPDSDFPDGICTIVEKRPLGLSLTANNGKSDAVETTLGDDLYPGVEVSLFEIPAFQICVEDASRFFSGDIVTIPSSRTIVDGKESDPLKLYVVERPDDWTITVIPLNVSRTGDRFNFVDSVVSGREVVRIGQIGEIDALALALSQVRQ